VRCLVSAAEFYDLLHNPIIGGLCCVVGLGLAMISWLGLMVSGEINFDRSSLTTKGLGSPQTIWLSKVEECVLLSHSLGFQGDGIFQLVSLRSSAQAKAVKECVEYYLRLWAQSPPLPDGQGNEERAV